MARDGNEALAQCSVERPDIVLTDIVMPDKEGLETIRERSSSNFLKSSFQESDASARTPRHRSRADYWMSHAEVGC